jgi:hypothetical protein
MIFFTGERVRYVYRTPREDGGEFLGTVTRVHPGRLPYEVDWDNGSSEQRYDRDEIEHVAKERRDGD